MSLSRRSVAKGAVWSVPAVSLAAPSPATAASAPAPAPGLQGWSYWTRDCSSSPVVTLSPQDPADGLYPAGKYGYYVYNATATDVSNACMTFSYPSSIGPLTFTAYSDNGAGWSTPVSVTPAGSGLITFRTCYSGAWVNVAASGSTPAYTRVANYPHFYANAPRACMTNPVTVTITRTVVVKGTTYTVNRTIQLP